MHKGSSRHQTKFMGERSLTDTHTHTYTHELVRV